MFKIYNPQLRDELASLQDITLPVVFDNILRNAAKISLRLGINVYFYNFDGYLDVAKTDRINFLDEEIDFYIMKDGRIAVRGVERLSLVLTRKHMMIYFRQFHKFKLPVQIDNSGIYYYEKSMLPYNVIQGKLCTFGDPSTWSRTKNNYYWSLWRDCDTLNGKHIMAWHAVPILPDGNPQRIY